MIDGHGDDIYNQSSKIISNFSSNVCCRQDMSALNDHLRLHIGLIHSYPEPDAGSLVKLLAKVKNISCDNVLATNGATESIYLIAQAFQGRKSAIIYPTFSEYADACSINRHTTAWVSSLEKIADDTDLVWLCNPNNPTGTVYDKSILMDYIEANPHQYIIIDQSYESFSAKPLLSDVEAVAYKNVILLHSMTKYYAIPGLRLGYITAHQTILRCIKKYCMPWSVNALAVEAGKFLLEGGCDTIDMSSYLCESNRLQNELKEVKGLDVFPTDTHFFLCKSDVGKASDLKKFLIEEHGILIRDAANFYGLDESYFRIAAQSPEENNILIKAIKKWMSKK